MNKNPSSILDIRFASPKAEDMVVVHLREAVDYAKRLDADDNVLSYETDVPLSDWQKKTNPVGIRKAYLQMGWKSDFLLKLADGTTVIRELVKKADLVKKAVVEQLEISRRYWTSANVGWAVVVVDE